MIIFLLLYYLLHHKKYDVIHLSYRKIFQRKRNDKTKIKLRESFVVIFECEKQM